MNTIAASAISTAITMPGRISATTGAMLRDSTSGARLSASASRNTPKVRAVSSVSSPGQIVPPRATPTVSSSANAAITSVKAAASMRAQRGAGSPAGVMRGRVRAQSARLASVATALMPSAIV